jgi:hypothetical protein
LSAVKNYYLEAKMLKTAFKPIKIVYFSVKVPKQECIENKNIESSLFNIKSKDGTDTKWKIVCNLKG